MTTQIHRLDGPVDLSEKVGVFLTAPLLRAVENKSYIVEQIKQGYGRTPIAFRHIEKIASPHFLKRVVLVVISVAFSIFTLIGLLCLKLSKTYQEKTHNFKVLFKEARTEQKQNAFLIEIEGQISDDEPNICTIGKVAPPPQNGLFNDEFLISIATQVNHFTYSEFFSSVNVSCEEFARRTVKNINWAIENQLKKCEDEMPKAKNGRMSMLAGQICRLYCGQGQTYEEDSKQIAAASGLILQGLQEKLFRIRLKMEELFHLKLALYLAVVGATFKYELGRDRIDKESVKRIYADDETYRRQAMYIYGAYARQISNNESMIVDMEWSIVGDQTAGIPRPEGHPTERQLMDKDLFDVLVDAAQNGKLPH